MSATDPGGERYVIVDLAILEALRALWDESGHPRLSRSTVKLLLQLVRLDKASGTLVLGLRFVHDLEVEEKGFGSI
jgi:hypothetical protein